MLITALACLAVAIIAAPIAYSDLYSVSAATACIADVVCCISLVAFVVLAYVDNAARMRQAFDN